MAMIPLKQRVTVIRKPLTDEFGEPIAPPEEITMKCRVDDEIKTVLRSTSGNGTAYVSAEEVLSSATITFDKNADIRYDDEIRFINEHGRLSVYTPLRIYPIRGIGGKPVLVEVNV